MSFRAAVLLWVAFALVSEGCQIRRQFVSFSEKIAQVRNGHQSTLHSKEHTDAHTKNLVKVASLLYRAVDGEAQAATSAAVAVQFHFEYNSKKKFPESTKEEWNVQLITAKEEIEKGSITKLKTLKDFSNGKVVLVLGDGHGTDLIQFELLVGGGRRAEMVVIGATYDDPVSELRDLMNSLYGNYLDKILLDKELEDKVFNNIAPRCQIDHMNLDSHIPKCMSIHNLEGTLPDVIIMRNGLCFCGKEETMSCGGIPVDGKVAFLKAVHSQLAEGGQAFLSGAATDKYESYNGWEVAVGEAGKKDIKAAIFIGVWKDIGMTFTVKPWVNSAEKKWFYIHLIK